MEVIAGLFLDLLTAVFARHQVHCRMFDITALADAAIVVI